MESRIYRAAMKGKPDILNEYTDQCALKFTPNNNTVLHVIADFGHSRCVAGILNECPFLLRRENTALDTPIHIAVAGGHYHVVKSLVNFAKSNDPCVKVVREMLRVRNRDEDSPLHLAARCQNPIGIVRLLTTEDPEFDHRLNKAGETPLHMVVVQGSDVAVVSQILKNCKARFVLENLQTKQACLFGFLIPCSGKEFPLNILLLEFNSGPVLILDFIAHQILWDKSAMLTKSCECDFTSLPHFK